MCRSGCPTQDHDSWGECFRAAGVEFGNPGQRKAGKLWDSELALYRKARENGLSPKTTRRADAELSFRMADKGVFRQ